MIGIPFCIATCWMIGSICVEVIVSFDPEAVAVDRRRQRQVDHRVGGEAGEVIDHGRAVGHELLGARVLPAVGAQL